MVFLLALLGLVLGVIINSLADNLPPDAHDVRRPPRRPHCRHCGQAHQPLYWSAVVAYLLRGGRCEHCDRRRPLRSLLVELASAASLAYVWLWALADGPVTVAVVARFLAAASIVAIFILITVIDIEHRLILRIVVLPAIVVVAILGSVDPGRGLVKTLLGGAAGYAIMFGVFLLAEVYTAVQNRLRGKPMEEVAFGGGDVNLAAVVGCVVGWPGVLLALLIAVFTGAAYSLGIIIPQLLQRRYSPHSVFPYGPFLVLGALLIYFYGPEFAQYWLSTR
jgi:prepilin signal peptidase PulO-like enzyme (type II secretory pathway)